MNTDKKEYGISVIIPCYNTEQYVEETLKSVLDQSFKDYEIICLNDGSTDGTLEILNRYQKLYSNIRVISSEHYGVAYQRNIGVQCARGKYIYYVDSDDLLKENCLETLYQHSEADNLDVLYFEADSFYETKEIEEAFPQFLTLYHRHKAYDGIYDGRKLYIQMENAGDIKMQLGMQFIRRQFLLDNDIKFGMERYFEDNLYTIQVMIKADKARCVRDNLYLRRVRANSIMTTSENKMRFECYLEVITGLMKILEDEKKESALQEAIYKRIRGTFINIFKDYLKVPEEKKKEFFGNKNSLLYLLIGMAFFINIEEVNRKETSAKLKKAYKEKSEINAKLQSTYVEKSEINAKLQSTYVEKSEINAKLQSTYAEKSEINAKLQKTYEEKSEINAKLKKAYEEKTERGEKIKELHSEIEIQKRKFHENKKLLKETTEELNEAKQQIELLRKEKEEAEKHLLVRVAKKICK
mgnify:CR=1 FL=1